MKQSTTWQAWEFDGCITFAPTDRIAGLVADGQLGGDAVLLHEIVASTGESAMTQHYQKMGWNAYQPEGDPKPCPNDCGGEYYPFGYGDCPNCGHLG